MKTTFTSLFLFCSLFGFAQQLSNGSFENWGPVTQFEDPVPYITSNFQSFISTTSGNVEKISPGFQGNFSALFTTVETDTDTIPGIGIIGDPSSPDFEGGAPYGFMPDSLVGFARFNCSIQDTGLIVGLFVNNGQPLGSFQFPFVGNQPGFARFSVPVLSIPFSPQPDSLLVYILSSTAEAPVPGNFIELDALEFISSSGTIPPFPNGGFENWLPFETQEPQHWNTINFACDPFNPSATESSDSYSGNSSLRIETVLTNFGDTLGIVTNGDFLPDFPSGGMPVYQNPAVISGYYKYFPQGPDTGLMGVSVTRFDQASQSTFFIDSALFQFTAASNWTPFTQVLSYSAFPTADTLNVSFSSSNIHNNSSYIGLGSYLLIDSVRVDYLPLGFAVESKSGYTAAFVGGDRFFFSGNKKPSSVVIYDAAGKQIVNQSAPRYQFSGDHFSFDVPMTALAAGCYVWNVADEDGRVSSGKLVLTR